ncbi:MAG: TlpA family protein disulfide reductase [Cytophagales bacterium]|nr:MAG: TlpA family protein disulfide reductase [Cytophagales bacterium]
MIQAQNTATTTFWVGHLALQNGVQLPFVIEVENGAEGKSFIRNGAEKLPFDETVMQGDSIYWHMDLFDAVLQGKKEAEGKKIVGKWVRYGLANAYEVDFVLEKQSAMPTYAVSSEKKISGTWEVTFNPDSKNAYPAIGIFRADANQKGIEGTFLTTTGDYRYLYGKAENDVMSLYTFDMSHAFVFEAKLQPDGTMKGSFWSGKAGFETWVARPNPQATLPAPDQLTFLKQGYDKITFSFPNLEGQKISLEDEKYKNKVVIIQILGSWCPNCMDETAFLAPWYEQNKQRGVEIIGLAYERSPVFEVAKERVKAMKERFKIQYEVLIAGTNNKEEAAKTLPMLNALLAFPTTIIIDKTGKVQRIHTGFSGPGTGEHYQRFQTEFNALIDRLLK